LTYIALLAESAICYGKSRPNHKPATPAAESFDCRFAEPHTRSPRKMNDMLHSRHYLCLLILPAALLAQSPAKIETPGKLPAFNLSNLDRAADPCTDFYQYACGAWTAQNPVPADQSRWGRFDELQERNLTILRGILEKASAGDPKRSPLEQKI